MRIAVAFQAVSIGAVLSTPISHSLHSQRASDVPTSSNSSNRSDKWCRRYTVHYIGANTSDRCLGDGKFSVMESSFHVTHAKR